MHHRARVRRVLRISTERLTESQQKRLDPVFTDEQHLGVQATHSADQRIVAADRHPDRAAGKTVLQTAIKSLRRGVPAVLPDLAP